MKSMFAQQRPSQTKVVATLGPASDSPEMIEKLILAGVDIFRLNMAHGTTDAQMLRLNTIREVSQSLGIEVGVLADLAGPKIRLGELPDDQFQCNAGESVRFVRGNSSTTPGHFTCTYASLVDELSVGDRVMLADGTVALRVEVKSCDEAICVVTQSGLVRSRQGVNLPGVRLSIPTLQPIDKTNAIWAAQVGIDFLGLSFVRTAGDIKDLQAIIAENQGQCQVIAKIEKPEALENIDAIVRTADAIMVARGDLGVEIDIAEIAVVQKRIIELCRRYNRPVITATQMLDSMQQESLPTRAEATDVANAVLDGTDACMLSGETAVGRYPVESVEMMHRIALATESIRQINPPPTGRFAATAEMEPTDPIMQSVAQSAAELADRLGAAAILVSSKTGRSALALSRHRKFVTTFGVSGSVTALRRMALYWGVMPMPNIPANDPREMVEHFVAVGKELTILKPGDTIVVLAQLESPDSSQNTVHVHLVE